jgi:hypothetical protein
MNSLIRGSRLAVFALCGTALVACDSIKDVRENPTFAIPTEKVALSGTITGLGVGTTRPVELTMAITNDHPFRREDDPDNDGVRTAVFSVRGVDTLDFGALDVGATYAITVSKQPFGRVCTPVAKASGTVAASFDAAGNLKPIEGIQIECVRDSTALYHVTANFAALGATLPAGFALTMTTEEGAETVTPTAGSTSATFALPVFYPDANPPAFAYRVTATYVGNGTVNSCAVTNGSGELGTGSGDVTNVTVTGCSFAITATASYAAPPGGAAAPIAAGGELGLKNLSGTVVSTAPLAAGAAVTLGTGLPSNAGALYEVLVTAQPANQFCTVDNGGVASLVPLAYVDDPTTPGRDPKITPANPANVAVQVRCRNVPVAARQLTGTYQVLRGVPTAPANPGDPASVAAHIRLLATSPDRQFMTFFANGTFLYGVHHATPASPANSAPLTGVEHGFYSYDNVAQRLAFNIFTDTNGSVGSSAGITVPAVAGCGYSFSVTFPGSVGPACAPGTVTGPVTVFPACGNTCTITAPAYVDVTRAVASNPNGGLSGVGGNFAVRLAFNPAAFPPNFAAATAPLTASGVTKSPAIPGVAPVGGLPTPDDPGLPAVGPQLNLTFGAVTWTLVQPISSDWEWNDSVYPGASDEPFWAPEKMQGAWVTPDSKQVWIYNPTSVFGWHAGVNGAPNLQDSCFPIEFRATDFGYDRFYARRSGGNCTPGTFPSIDVPSSLSVPALVPGFVGRMPGSLSTAVQVPSPNYFRVVPGTPDTLAVQPTQNDVPVGDPLVFIRSVAN